MALQLNRRLFTVDDYYRMAQAGVFKPGERVELIEGEIVRMNAIGNRHAARVDAITLLLVERVTRRAIVRVQNPVRLSETSEPEPDFALLRLRPNGYADRHPLPPDVLLEAELADSFLDYDQEVKAPLYGRRGIAEYWLVDLDNRRVTVYRDPSETGYASIRLTGPEEVLSPVLFPDLSVTVGELLGDLLTA